MSYIGQSLTAPTEKEEAIFGALLETARKYFPRETQKAEAWIQDQALKYGYIYSKEEIRRKAEATIKSPWLWLAGGGLLGLLLLRR